MNDVCDACELILSFYGIPEHKIPAELREKFKYHTCNHTHVMENGRCVYCNKTLQELPTNSQIVGESSTARSKI